MHSLLRAALELSEYTQAWRRDFHSNPELGFQEYRTAGIVARELVSLGLEVTTDIAETGVVALLHGAGSGPVVMLRFDMDALPITEETGAEYASQNVGVMHACGHDGHTAIGLATARMLTSLRQKFSGTVKFVFQPAEEGLGGAKRMVAEGVLSDPEPDRVLGLHLWNAQPLGWLSVASGAIMAGAEEFRLRVIGKGGHGALPHLAVDPILTSAHIVTALQSIVSRNTGPLDSAVVSVGAVEGGKAFNVIPPEVIMRGTIRTFEAQVRYMVLERFKQVVSSTAEAMDCQVEINVEPLTPAVVNDQDVAARVARTAAAVLPDWQLDSGFRTMGSEDMAFFLEKVPGCFFFLGSANPKKGLNAPHHHPKFDFDEAVLPNAAALMTAAVLECLPT